MRKWKGENMKKENPWDVISGIERPEWDSSVNGGVIVTEYELERLYSKDFLEKFNNEEILNLVRKIFPKFDAKKLDKSGEYAYYTEITENYDNRINFNFMYDDDNHGNSRLILGDYFFATRFITYDYGHNQKYKGKNLFEIHYNQNYVVVIGDNLTEGQRVEYENGSEAIFRSIYTSLKAKEVSDDKSEKLVTSNIDDFIKTQREMLFSPVENVNPVPDGH